MSDMSSLSHEYASTTDFSHQVNQAVLLVKKLIHGRKQTEVDTPNLAHAFRLIEGIVVRLLQRLGSDDIQLDDDAEAKLPNIPEDVLIRLEEQEQGNLEYFIDDLRSLRDSLVHSVELTAKQVEILDSICEVADASASATFRKLWRR